MIRVAIVEDDKIVRQGLHLIIDSQQEFKCVGAFERCEALLKEVASLRPDVILMDINLKGGMSGIEGVKGVKKSCPSCVVIMQTVYEEDSKIFDALCSGASGYLLKKTSPSRLLEAIGEAVNGGAPMSPSIAKKVVEYFKRQDPPTAEKEISLSEREKEVLRLMEAGKPYKVIADDLHISIPTVRFHMGNIYKKLHASSQSEAVAKAVRKGLI
ncbi:MAG: response regulator transcription factor [Bacteroidetes bacterium]|nr:response regulator transcription factor [Bacteroidota bacterium]